MQTHESNKEREWWNQEPFRKPTGLSAIERGIDAKFSYDIPALLAEQHARSVQACMEGVESASLTGDFDAKNIKLIEAVYELAKKQFLSALSEMKEKPRV